MQKETVKMVAKEMADYINEVSALKAKLLTIEILAQQGEISEQIIFTKEMFKQILILANIDIKKRK